MTATRLLLALFALAAPASAQTAAVADTQFSVPRGFYTLPFDCIVSTPTPCATIRYTLDGGDPRTSTKAAQGTTPVRVRIDPSSTNGGLRVTAPAVTLRVYAFKTGLRPTNVDAQTYVFLDKVLTQTRPAGYPTLLGTKALSYDVDSKGVRTEFCR